MNTVPVFDRISREYDLMNHTLSFYQDKRWRRKCRKVAGHYPHDKIIDIACGTGALTIELCKLKASTIVAADPSAEMIKIAREKFHKHRCPAQILQAPSESLPLPDLTFDLATCAFGIRNFDDLQKGLKEIHRILKKDGVFIVMEFGFPPNKWLRKFFSFYFLHILPRLAILITKHAREYLYFKTSVKSFPYGKDLLPFVENAGFKTLECRKLSGGIVYLYVFRKITDS